MYLSFCGNTYLCWRPCGQQTIGQMFRELLENIWSPITCCVVMTALSWTTSGCKMVEVRRGTWEGYAKEGPLYSLDDKSVTSAILFQPRHPIGNGFPSNPLILVSDSHYRKVLPPDALQGKQVRVPGTIIFAVGCVTDWQSPRKLRLA